MMIIVTTMTGIIEIIITMTVIILITTITIIIQ